MDNQKCYKNTTINLHWTPIIAGSFVGVGLGFLLNMFSMAIGLSAYTAPASGAPVVAIGGVLGLLIGVIISMGTAGFVAGYLGRFYHCYCHGGVLYGFVTWSLALMLSVVLVMPMAHYVSFYEENLDPNLAPTQMSTTDVSVSVAPQQQNLPAPTAMATNPKQLVWNGWILFALFFIGGISSCIGACYGMRCEKEENNLNSSL